MRLNKNLDELEKFIKDAPPDISVEQIKASLDRLDYLEYLHGCIEVPLKISVSAIRKSYEEKLKEKNG